MSFVINESAAAANPTGAAVMRTSPSESTRRRKFKRWISKESTLLYYLKVDKFVKVKMADWFP